MLTFTFFSVPGLSPPVQNERRQSFRKATKAVCPDFPAVRKDERRLVPFGEAMNYRGPFIPFTKSSGSVETADVMDTPQIQFLMAYGTYQRT
jgi:hypothetical protein